jgi:16S rRNA U1498 N3-methylase RsmE
MTDDGRIEKGEAITLNDNNDYVVADIVEQGDKRYLYLINEETTKMYIAEEIVNGDDLIIQTVGDKDKIAEIIKIVTERLNQ